MCFAAACLGQGAGPASGRSEPYAPILPPMLELLIDELKDLYSAEKQIVPALPKLAKAASTPDLQQAILNHLEETKGQVARREKIGELLGKKMTGRPVSG